jgi:ribosomal protein S12 methylthiotransferase
MKTVALCNLGCSKNVVDGETIAGYLAASGYQPVDQYDLADVIVVNTCAFIREAKEEAIEHIMAMAQYKTTGRCTTLVVAGCFSQRYRHEVARQFPEVDLWTGIDDWRQALAEFFSISVNPRATRRLTRPAGTQYLKIAEGCSHRCAYCAIPAIRGRFRSRPARAIIDEARRMNDQGARECILVAQDCSAWGSDSGSSLVKLLEGLLARTSVNWIRTMYLHPRSISDELLRLVAAEPRLCSYFDVPLQHVAATVLKGMRRGGSPAGMHRLIERIRTLCPQAAIRTTFILGFPGETDGHVRQLLDFMEWARFDKLGVFPFSPEEGTAAFAMRPRPRSSTAQRRCEEVMTLQREISREINAARIGSTLPVIVDQAGAGLDQGEGRTQWDAPEIDGRVFFPGDGLKVGTIVPMKISAASDYDLSAVPSAPRASIRRL